jgi:hypothetical protein
LEAVLGLPTGHLVVGVETAVGMAVGWRQHEGPSGSASTEVETTGMAVGWRSCSVAGLHALNVVETAVGRLEGRTQCPAESDEGWVGWRERYAKEGLEAVQPIALVDGDLIRIALLPLL